MQMQGGPEDLPAKRQKEGVEKNMADFVQKTVTKTAVRELANPIADVSAFNTIVEAVITANPFGCVAYTEGGVTHQPVEKSKESYVAKVVYQDTLAKTVGNESGKFEHDRRVQCRCCGTPRRHRTLHCPRRHTGPGLWQRDLLGHAQVPGPERGDCTWSRLAATA